MPTRETIEVYYQQQMRASKESGLDYGSHDAERHLSAEEEEGHRPSFSIDEETGGPTAPVPVPKAEQPNTEPIARSGLDLDSPATETHLENEVEYRDPSEPQSAPDALGEPAECSAKGDTEPAEHGPEVLRYRPSREPGPRLSRLERVRSLWSSVASNRYSKSSYCCRF